MATRDIKLINDLQHVPAEAYDQIIDQYVRYAGGFRYVKSIYLVGSMDDPGISDIDLIVVVDPVTNPLGMNRLSLHQSDISQLQRYLFAHDIYLYDTETFRDVHYTNYFGSLKLIYGTPQVINEPSPAERQILSIQIIFDFIASRLAMFLRMLASGTLPLRGGVLLRVASIKHSAALLNGLGVWDEDIEKFVQGIASLRKSPTGGHETEVNRIFFDSFYYFSRIVEHAASVFKEKYLTYYSQLDNSNSLKLNDQFIVRFVDQASGHYRNPYAEPTIYYPKESFYHYFAYRRYENLLGERTRNLLSYVGDETCQLDELYGAVLGRRLDALSNHLLFLFDNRALFAMRGTPGVQEPVSRPVEGGRGRPQDTTANLVTTGARLKAPAEHIPFEESYHIESLDKIREESGIDVNRLEFSGKDYESWLQQLFPDWREGDGHDYHKKLIELFVTYQVLVPAHEDSFMDAAGGRNTYINNIPCRKRYLQGLDNVSGLEGILGPDVEIIPGDAAHIPLPDGSLSRISCHHSIEHFQGDSDSAFITEVQRLLRPGGRCCVIPIFIADKYIEVTRSRKGIPLHYDPRSVYLVDPQARLTGGPSCGDYARVYDIRAFTRRIAEYIDKNLFTVQLSEILIDGRQVPDMSLPCHQGISRANFPYRALTIERKVDVKK